MMMIQNTCQCQRRNSRKRRCFEILPQILMNVIWRESSYEPVDYAWSSIIYHSRDMEICINFVNFGSVSIFQDIIEKGISYC